jgi:transposase
MIDRGLRKVIFKLHLKGFSIRHIANRFSLSRNTVRKIIQQEGAMPEKTRCDKQHIDEALLRRLYEACSGIGQRVCEKLNEEEGIAVKYSTLTRMLREAGISKPPKTRCDSKPDEPGAEMQHDTSPYRLKLDGQLNQLIASLLYLRYSKRRYLKFYRAFDRFKMKCFFHEALTFWGYAASVCIIDNTNLARLRGTGKHAVIVPEMETFAKRYGFSFVCHAKGHPNRKAGEERSFRTVETNFFPGRTFRDLEDLNRQAFKWATVRMEHRPQGKAKLIPAKAFEHEHAFLKAVPSDMPGPYRPHTRLTDQYGYVSFDGNFYWVPGTSRLELTILEYADQLEIYHRREELATYALPPDGVKNKRFSPEGKPSPYMPNNRKRPTCEEQQRLRALGTSVSAYVDFVRQAKGIQPHAFIRKLDALRRQMSEELFVRAIERALHYRILSIEAIRRIALLYATEGAGLQPWLDVDARLEQRPEFQEGRLTEMPDLSIYDRMLDEDQEPDTDEDTEASIHG